MQWSIGLRLTPFTRRHSLSGEFSQERSSAYVRPGGSHVKDWKRLVKSRSLYAGNWLLLAASILVSLFVLEGGARFLSAHQPSIGGAEAACSGEVQTFSSNRHHRFIPGSCRRHQSPEFDYLWKINSLGMRDREHPRLKPSGVYRILALGDSFVQGHGVRLEDTMVWQLETSLARTPRERSVEVLNAGIFGYSPLLEYLYLRELIEPFDPDLVVVGFFLGNDVGEDAFYASRARFAPGGESATFMDVDWPWTAIVKALDAEDRSNRRDAAGPSVGFRRLAAGIHERSALLRFVEERLAGSRSRRDYASRREKEFALVAARRGDIRYDLGLVNYPSGSRETRLGYWSRSLEYLEKMRGLCDAHGTRLVLMVIPPIERLLGQTTLDEPYEILDAFGKAHDVPVLNLLPSFQAQQAEQVYFKYDRHWTPRGHQVAAEVLETNLRRWHVLPPETQ